MNDSFAWLQETPARTLLDAFETAGSELRFVGGCVRDSVLGRPIQDIDACTPTPPEQVMGLLADAHIKTIPTGIAHGTITAIIEGTPIEITSLRKDTACDGRHATVVYTDAYEEDAARRDFTMNALYCDRAGQLTDFFGGIGDAQKGRVCFIGEPEARIQEDALRMLRLFRFQAHYGQEPLQNKALEACRTHAPMLEQLSGERIQQEMLKLLAAPEPYAALEALQRAKLGAYLWECARPLDALTRIGAAEAMLRKKPDAILRLSCILEEPEDAAWVAERWRLSKRDSTRLQQLLTPSPWKDLKRHIVEEGAAPTADRIARNYALGQMDDTTLYHAADVVLHWKIPAFPVSGKDLIARDVDEGEALGNTLETLRLRWIESQYRLGKEELLESLNQ